MKRKAVSIIFLALAIVMLLTLPAAAATEVAAPQTLTAMQYEQMVKDTLAAMATAYQQRDLRAFMSLVSADFVGDDFLMYRAVRKDFRYLDNIVLYLYVEGFAVNAKGRAQVTVKYNRNVIANKPGQNNQITFKDSGLTQMTFVVEDGQAKLYDVKFPLIFGLSEGMQVASGVVRSAESSNIMVIDRQGNVSVLPFNDALNLANGVSAIRGTVHMRTTFGGTDSWSFADNRKITGIGLQGDFAFGDSPGMFILKAGTKYKKLTTGFFASTTQVPDPATTAYNTAAAPIMIFTGDVYALQLASGKFAIIEIADYNTPAFGDVSATVRYKYQPSGSRVF